jgi:hypothetical protein
LPAFGRLGRPSKEDRILIVRGTARPIRRVAATLILLAAAFATSAAPAAALSGVAWPTQSQGDRGTNVFAVQGLLRVGLLPDPLPWRRALLREIVMPPVDGGTWRALVWHFELPRFSSSAVCDYSSGNGPANWGTAETIAGVEAAGSWVVAHGYGRIAVGDVSFEHGGAIPGHVTHRLGLDADVRPLRKANDQCTARTRWTYSTYDRAATRGFVKAIRALSPGQVKLIYFNDPVLISEGLTTWSSGHDDHLHVRFCEPASPDVAYRC